MTTTRQVAVAGASGFVGTALVLRLIDAGFGVRRLARQPGRLEPLAGVDDRPFDLDGTAALEPALGGVDTAFYLVHAMEGGDGFAQRDRRYAHRFADAARAAGVRQVIYLGGLHPAGTDLSEHLRSRSEVGDILLAECGALHVRAGIIIGAGSASFEIMRDLVQRLPAMLTPRWLRNRCQAVDIDDVTAALVAAVDVPGAREVDLAGPDVLTYRSMLLRLAELMGRRRPIIVDVPVLTPGLSAHWLRFVTSVSLPVAQALVQSLRHNAVSNGHDLFAEVGLTPRGFDSAVRSALAARPAVTSVQVEHSWNGSHYSLSQRFELSPGAAVNRRLVERVDTTMRDLTRTVTLRTVRWRSDDLRFGRVSLIRLGGARWTDSDGGGPAMARPILGGWLTAGAAGTLGVRAWPGAGPPAIEVRLTEYRPRLPRFLYLRFQEPLHRALVVAAMRRALTRGSLLGRPALSDPPSAPAPQHRPQRPPQRTSRAPKTIS